MSATFDRLAVAPEVLHAETAVIGFHEAASSGEVGMIPLDAKPKYPNVRNLHRDRGRIHGEAQPIS